MNNLLLVFLLYLLHGKSRHVLTDVAHVKQLLYYHWLIDMIDFSTRIWFLL